MPMERYSLDSLIEHDGKRKGVTGADVSRREKVNAVFENPLAGIPEGKLMQDVEDFCIRHDLTEYMDDMKKGARVSKDPKGAFNASFLTEEERQCLVREKTHKWSHPFALYWLCGA